MAPPFAHLQPVMTFEEIGAALGISRQGAHELYRSGMRKLKCRRISAQALSLLKELDQSREYAYRVNVGGASRQNWTVEF